MQKVFGHCNVLMYISYKKTFFFKTLLQGEFFLMNFLQTKTCLNVVLHCDFSIILLSKDFKSSHVKHKTKFWTSRRQYNESTFEDISFRFVFKLWIFKIYAFKKYDKIITKTTHVLAFVGTNFIKIEQELTLE